MIWGIQNRGGHRVATRPNLSFTEERKKQWVQLPSPWGPVFRMWFHWESPGTFRLSLASCGLSLDLLLAAGIPGSGHLSGL